MWTKSNMLHGAVLLALLSLGTGQTPGGEQGEMTGAQSELEEMAAERSEMAGGQGEMTGAQGEMTQNQGQLSGGKGQMTGGTGAQQEIEPPGNGEYVGQPGAGAGQGSQLGAGSSSGSGARAGDRAWTGVGAGSGPGSGSRAGEGAGAGAGKGPSAGAGTAGTQQEFEPPEIGEYVSQSGGGAGAGTGAGAGAMTRTGTGARVGSDAGAGAAAAAGTAGAQYEFEPPEIGEYGAGAHTGTGAGTVAVAGTAGASSGQGQKNMGSAADTQASYKAGNTNLGPLRNQGTSGTNTNSNTKSVNTSTNKNAYANVNSNTNTYGTTNPNTNTYANANSNTNTYPGSKSQNTNTYANTNSNTNTYGTTNTNTNSNANTYSNTNANTYANVNSNTNGYGTTNSNTNTFTNVNSNTNTYSNTNSNTNAKTNANSNTNTYGNTNENTNTKNRLNGNTNANANTNTNANTNANRNANANPNSNTNLKTYSNANTKPANSIEYEPPEYPTGNQAGMTSGSQRTQTNPNYEYEPPEPLSINPFYMEAARRLYQPSAPSQSKTFGYTNQYNQQTGSSGSQNIYSRQVMSNIQNQKANQYARNNQQTALKPSTPSYIGTNQETQQKQLTSAGQNAGDVYAQSQVLQQQAATRLSHQNTGTSSVSSSLYPMSGQLTQPDHNSARAGMNPAGLAVLNRLYQRFRQIASANNYDYNKVRMAVSKPISGINIPTSVSQAVKTTSQQATDVTYNPTTTNTKAGYAVGSQTSAGSPNTQTTFGKYPGYQSNSQTRVVDVTGHLPGGQSPTKTYIQRGSQTEASTYDPLKASSVSGGSQTISGSLTGQSPGTTQVQEQTSITTQGQSTGGVQYQRQTSGTTQIQAQKVNSQGQGQMNGASSAQSSSNQTPLTGAADSIGPYKPPTQSNSLQRTLSSPLQYPQGQSVQPGGDAEYQTDPVLTNLQANVGRMIALKMQELARRQYQQRYGFKPVV